MPQVTISWDPPANSNIIVEYHIYRYKQEGRLGRSPDWCSIIKNNGVKIVLDKPPGGVLPTEHIDTVDEAGTYHYLVFSVNTDGELSECDANSKIEVKVAEQVVLKISGNKNEMSVPAADSQQETGTDTVVWSLLLDASTTINLNSYIAAEPGFTVQSFLHNGKILSKFDRDNFKLPDSPTERLGTVFVTLEESFKEVEIALDTSDPTTAEAVTENTITYKIIEKEGATKEIIYPDVFYNSSCFEVSEWVTPDGFDQEGFDKNAEIPEVVFDDDYKGRNKIKLRLKKKTFSITFQVDPIDEFMSLNVGPEERGGKISLDLNMLENDTNTGSSPWQQEKQITQTGFDSTGVNPQTTFTCDNNFELNIGSFNNTYGFDLDSDFESEGSLKIDTRKSNLGTGKVVFSIQSDVVIKIKYTKYFYLTIYVQDPNLLGLAYYANDGSQLNLYKYFDSLVQLPEEFIEGSRDRIDREEFHETYPNLSIITHYNWDQVQHSILEDRDEGWHKNDNRMIFRSPLAYRFKLNTKNKIVKISPEYIDKTRNSNHDLFETSFEPQDLCDISPLPGTENAEIIDLGEGKQQITVNEEDTVLMLSHKRFWKSGMSVYLSEENCIGDDCGKYISSENFEDFGLSYTLPVTQNAEDPESNLISFEVNEAYEFDRWEVNTRMIYLKANDPLNLGDSWNAFGVPSNTSVIGDRIAKPIISKKCGDFSFDDVYFDHYLMAHSFWHIAARQGDTLVFGLGLFDTNSKSAPQVWSIAKDTDTLKEKKSSTGIDGLTEEWLVVQPESDEYFVVIDVSDQDTVGSKLKETSKVTISTKNPISAGEMVAINTYSHIDVYTQDKLISDSSSYQAVLYDEIPRQVTAHIKLKTFTIKILSSHPDRGSVSASVTTKGATNDFVDLLDDDGNVIGKVLENATAEHIFTIEALRTTGTSIFTNWSIKNEDDIVDFVNFDNNENNWEPLKDTNRNLTSYFEIEIVANFIPLYNLITYIDPYVSESTLTYLEGNIYYYNQDATNPKRPFFNKVFKADSTTREIVEAECSLLNGILPLDNTAVNIDRDLFNPNLSIVAQENFNFKFFGYPQFSLFGDTETSVKLTLDADILQISNYRFLRFDGHGNAAPASSGSILVEVLKSFAEDGFEVLEPSEITSPTSINAEISVTKDSINIARFSDIFLITDKSNQDRGSVVLEALTDQSVNFTASTTLDNSYWISPNDVSSIITYEPDRVDRFRSRDIDAYKEDPQADEYLKVSFAGVKVKAEAKEGWAINRWKLLKGSGFIYNITEVTENDAEEEFNLILAHDISTNEETHHALEIRAEFVKLSTLTIIVEEDFMGYAEGAGTYKETDKITVRAFRNPGVRLDGTEYVRYEIAGYEEVLERGQESGIKFRDTLDDIFADPQGRSPEFFIKSDVTLKVKLEYTKYLFSTKLTTIQQWQGGVIDLTTTEDGIYEPIDDIYVKAVPDAGFVFYEWKLVSGTIPDGFDVRSPEQTFKLQGHLEIEARFATVNTVSVLIGDGKAADPADQVYINDNTIAYVEQGALDPSFYRDFFNGTANYDNYEDYVTFDQVVTKSYNGPQDIFVRVTLVNTNLYQLGEWAIAPSSVVYLIHDDGNGRNGGTGNIRTFNSKYINKRPLFFECKQNTIVTIFLDRANILTITMDSGIESVETRKIDLLNTDGQFKYFSNEGGAVDPYTKYDEFNVVNQAWVDYEIFWLNAKVKDGYRVNGIEVLSGALGYPTKIGPFLLSDGTVHYVDHGDTGSVEEHQLAMMPYLETFATGNDSGKIGVMQGLTNVRSFTFHPVTRISLFGEYLSKLSLLEADGGKDDGATPEEREAYGLDNTSSYFPNFIVTTSWFIKQDTSIHITSSLRPNRLTVVFVGPGIDLDQNQDLDSILDIMDVNAYSVYNGYGSISISSPYGNASIVRADPDLTDRTGPVQDMGLQYTKDDEITLVANEYITRDNSMETHGSPTHLHSVKSRFRKWKILSGSTVENINTDSASITFKIAEDTTIICQLERFFEIEVEDTTSSVGIEISGNTSYSEMDLISRELTVEDQDKKWWEAIDTNVELSASAESNSGQVFGGWVFVSSGEVGGHSSINEHSDDGEVEAYVTGKISNELSFAPGPDNYLIRSLFYSKKVKLSISYITAYTVSVDWEIKDGAGNSIENANLNEMFDYLLDGGTTGYNGSGYPIVIYTDDISNASTSLILQEGEEFHIAVADHDGLTPYYFQNITSRGSYTAGLKTSERQETRYTYTASESSTITAILVVECPKVLVWPVMDYPPIRHRLTNSEGEYTTTNRDYYTNQYWEKNTEIYSDSDALIPGGNLTHMNNFSPVLKMKKDGPVYASNDNGRWTSIKTFKNISLGHSNISGLIPYEWEFDNVEYLTRVQFVPTLWTKLAEQLTNFKDLTQAVYPSKYGSIYMFSYDTKYDRAIDSSLLSMRPDYFIQGYNTDSFQAFKYGENMMEGGLVETGTKGRGTLNAKVSTKYALGADDLVPGMPGLNISRYNYNPNLQTLRSGIQVNFNSYEYKYLDKNVDSLKFNLKNITRKKYSREQLKYGFIEHGIVFLKYKRKEYSLIVKTGQSIKGTVGILNKNGDLLKIQPGEKWSDSIKFLSMPRNSSDKISNEWQATIDPSTSDTVGFFVSKQPGQRESVNYYGLTKTGLAAALGESEPREELPSDEALLDKALTAAKLITPGSGNNFQITRSGSNFEVRAEIGKNLDQGIVDYDFIIAEVSFQLTKQSIEPENGYDESDNSSPTTSWEETNRSLYGSFGCSGWPTFSFSEVYIHGDAFSDGITINGSSLSDFFSNSTKNNWGKYIVDNQGMKFTFLKEIINPCEKQKKGADQLHYNYKSDNPFNSLIIGMFGGRPLVNYYGDKIMTSGAQYVFGWTPDKNQSYTMPIKDTYLSKELNFKYYRGNSYENKDKHKEYPALNLIVYNKSDPGLKNTIEIGSTVKAKYSGGKWSLDYDLKGGKTTYQSYSIPSSLISAYVNSETNQRPELPTAGYIIKWKNLTNGLPLAHIKGSLYATDLGKLAGKITAPSESSIFGSWDPSKGASYYGSNSSGKYKGVKMSVGYKILDVKWVRRDDTTRTSKPYADGATLLKINKLYGTQQRYVNSAKMYGKRSNKKTDPAPETVKAPEYDVNYPLYLPFYMAIDADGWNYKWYDLPDQLSIADKRGGHIENGSGRTKSLMLEGGFIAPGTEDSNTKPSFASSAISSYSSILHSDYYRGYSRLEERADEIFLGYSASMSRWMFTSYRFRWANTLYSTWDGQGFDGIFSGELKRVGETNFRAGLDYDGSGEGIPLYGHEDIGTKAASHWYYPELDVEGTVKRIPMRVIPSPFMTSHRNGLSLSNKELKFPSIFADEEMSSSGIILYYPYPKMQGYSSRPSNVKKSPFTDVAYRGSSRVGGSSNETPLPYLWKYGTSVESMREVATSSEPSASLFQDHINTNIHSIEKITGLTINQVKNLIPTTSITKDFGLSITHKEILTSYTMNLFRNRVDGTVNNNFAPYSYTHPYKGLIDDPDNQREGKAFWPLYLDHVSEDPQPRNFGTGKYGGSLTLYGLSISYDKITGPLDERISYAARKYEILMIRSSEVLFVFARMPFSRSKYQNSNGWVFCCSREVGVADKDSEVFMEHGAGGSVHWGTNEVVHNGRENFAFTKPGTAPMDAAVYYDTDNLTPILRIAYRTVENSNFIGHSMDYSPQVGEVVKNNKGDEYTVVEKDYSYYDESAAKDKSRMVLSSRWYKIRSNKKTGSTSFGNSNISNAGVKPEDLYDVYDEHIVTHIEGHEENRDLVVVEDIKLPKTVNRRYENTGLKYPEENFRFENESLLESFKNSAANNNAPENIIEFIYELKYPVHSLGRHISLSGDGRTIALSADQRRYYMVDHDFSLTDGSLIKDFLVLNTYAQLSDLFKGLSANKTYFKDINSPSDYYYLPVNKDNYPIILADSPVNDSNKLNLLLGLESWPRCTTWRVSQYRCDTPDYQLTTSSAGVANLGSEFNSLYGVFWRYKNIHQRFLTYKLPA